jgi:hypothetical protein
MAFSSIENQELFERAARTVNSVYSQFAELKQQAEGMAAYASKMDRDYFTPSEDEAIRQLLITYWQLRSALFELVYELRIAGQEKRSDYDPLFLAGYAGALVLLDAARFIRERFHDSSLIRHKLNEPEPSFGISGGLYDSIQESWTNPSHMWHMFAAARCFEKNKNRLHSLRYDRESDRLIGIIEQLACRLHLSWTDYAKLRFRFRLRQFGSLLKRDLFYAAMFQMQKGIGILAADRYLKRGHQPGLPNSIRDALHGILAPGDILLVRKEFALTNYFLPGYWPHSALFLGSSETLSSWGLSNHPSIATRWQHFSNLDLPERGRVIEAMKDGVHLRSLDSPYRSDSILVLRPQLKPESIRQVVARAFLHEGKEYDFSFDFTVANRLVCTEVIYRAYDGVEGTSFPLSKRAGRLTLAALELVEMAMQQKHFAIEATYIPMLSNNLLRGNEAIDAVKRVSPSL